MSQTEKRIYLGKQPARVLLVDLSAPLDEDMCRGVVAALERCVSLACSLAGPPRLAFFGLYALGTYPEALLPLQHTRGNYFRIQLALHELVDRCREFSANDKLCNCICQGVLEVATMFKRQAHSLIQTSAGAESWSLLEMTLLTTQMSGAVFRQVEKASKHVDSEHLKRIQVVHVCSADRVATLDDTDADAPSLQSLSQLSDDTSGADSDSELSVVVNSISVDFSATQLDSFFRGWLHDVSTDSEHVQLVLPPDGAGGEKLVLKCDVQERILDPNLLPVAYQFSVHPAVMGMRPNVTAAPLKGGGVSVPVHRLNAVSRVPLSGVCDSVLHGMPLIVKATTCWRVEWDELERNQSRFHALCHHLLNKNEVLLCQLDAEPTPPPTRPGSSFRFHVPGRKPRGYFLLLPSHRDSLLIKSVVDADLVLPVDVAGAETPSDPESDAAVSDALSKVSTVAMFNPLLLSSGLSDALSEQLCRAAPPGGGGGGGALKRRAPGGTGPAPGAAARNSPQPAGGRGRHFSAFKQPSRGGSGKGSGAGRAQSDGSTWGSGARPAAVAAVVHPQRKRVRFQDEAADDDSDFHSPPGGEFPTSL